MTQCSSWGQTWIILLKSETYLLKYIRFQDYIRIEEGLVSEQHEEYKCFWIKYMFSTEYSFPESYISWSLSQLRLELLQSEFRSKSGALELYALMLLKINYSCIVFLFYFIQRFKMYDFFLGGGGKNAKWINFKTECIVIP